MMNIAICICGEPRMKQYGSESVRKFREAVKEYDARVDVFYHLWDHVTKRQRNHQSQDPFVEYVTAEEIEQLFPSTVGCVESKDVMDKDIDVMWDHACSLKEPNPRYESKDILKNQVYYSNTPGYSQLHSLCKNQLMRIEYEKNNNIQYDLIIKTRTDVEFECHPSFDHIKKIADNPNFQEQIFLPKIEVWSVKHELLIIPEFSLFFGNSHTLKKGIWEDFDKKIIPDMFYYRGGPHLSVRNDHTLFMNLVLNNAKVKVQGHLQNALTFKLHQMPTYYNEARAKYSHY